jgi:outer membrane protein assembly factor BamB
VWDDAAQVMRKKLRHIARILICTATSLALASLSVAGREADWSRKLDSRIRFYQMTELAIILLATEQSLYGIESDSGDILWRRKNLKLDETDVAPVSGTDILLLSLQKDDRTRLEAIDIFTGDTLWRSERVRGAPMQMAIDLENNLLAVAMVRDSRGRADSAVKRRAEVYGFDLRRGEEFWKHETDEIEMMPVIWNQSDDDEVDYTLDNYHPPMFLDGRLYLFYEGVALLDARTGRQHTRERFRINEEGLALTEADPVFDDRFIYTSGRGRVRAISRQTSRVEWEARDLGLTPEIILSGSVLYVRTGGQFTRIRDGEVEQRGPYGVSAIEALTGKILWRYKGADKGITNIATRDFSKILIADRDDLIVIDGQSGRREARLSHRVRDASFVLVNDRGQAVVGGTSEIASFDTFLGKEVWRARHSPPGRGVFRTVAAVALRAASLYFRYGNAGMAVLRGMKVARAASALRWSGLARSPGPNLTTLASNSAREYVSSRFHPLGVAGRIDRINTARSISPARPSSDVEERLLDRLDPAAWMERLSRFLMERRRFASLRGERMFFYTDLKQPSGRGLAVVNVNTGQTESEISLNELDDRFVTDIRLSRLCQARGGRLFSYPLVGR